MHEPLPFIDRDDEEYAGNLEVHIRDLEKVGRGWLRIGIRADQHVGWTMSGFLPRTETAARAKGLFILYVPIRMSIGPAIGIYLSKTPEVSKDELANSPDGIKPL